MIIFFVIFAHKWRCLTYRAPGLSQSPPSKNHTSRQPAVCADSSAMTRLAAGGHTVTDSVYLITVVCVGKIRVP